MPRGVYNRKGRKAGRPEGRKAGKPESRKASSADSMADLMAALDRVVDAADRLGQSKARVKVLETERRVLRSLQELPGNGPIGEDE